MNNVKNLLFTGAPGVGKTTLLLRAVKGMEGIAGFYTREMREGGERCGFEIVGFDGRRALFAHTRIGGRPMVGQYGVNLVAFEGFLAATPFSGPGVRLLVIDEIGRMECLSPLFRDHVTAFLDGEVPVVATVALRGDEFVEAVKRRPDVRVVTVTRENRDTLLPEARRDIAALVE
ncbi:MAG: nucleoside-triphosphatase [Methanofollis sp.]|uniref:nucleoside-triphosphatase n=1 Tax=Methanofollis sp. TaxID=2052835 RepID=UPI00261C61A0|nr:nucleoside-triphosphatase [Methanofollis sp.]MDD4255837.1 nucleoside-triphosphatase [Methanofollis sp.]